MKINIEDYLHKIDTAFKDKSKKDTQLIYVMIVVGIFAFSYLLFWDSSFAGFEKTRANVVALQNKINVDKVYLQNNPESVITNLNNEIKTINQKIALTKENNAYIKSKIETISALIYDERSWGEYIDSIATHAQRYNMKVQTFINKHAKKDQSFGHVLDISVESTGRFTNTLQFINALEQSELVVDLHDFNVEAKDKKISSDLNISVWGITY
ncbi:type 4a pilus biogenesis protein PilO [Sulfurimonas sp. C5]|uniref:type 4a pilus biogenesis protein PilO n=1 Tax=Sulfurimonas sp. C5 TaxID=3036947 RepID=UPI00245836A6|nr:type 4a pilus biogenesis protein PilO [Sulfurimonas sp. C5]MDH4943549.1 type 4a pilus biogenesis protein PilO [Sulfurimonas sp. C5]